MRVVEHRKKKAVNEAERIGRYIIYLIVIECVAIKTKVLE